jgi:hypothetical protein
MGRDAQTTGRSLRALNFGVDIKILLHINPENIRVLSLKQRMKTVTQLQLRAFPQFYYFTCEVMQSNDL